MASSSSPWPPHARRLPLANRSNLSSPSPAPSPAPPRSSKLPPPPLPANKENTHPLLLPPPPSPSHSSSLPQPFPSADLVRSSPPHRDRLPAFPVQDPPSRPPNAVDFTPARPPNGVDVESSFLTPRCLSIEDPLSSGVRLYSRRKPACAANLTMSCPPLDRSRIDRDKGDRPRHLPSKRAYDFTHVEAAPNSQGTSKKSKNRSRRRSLPEQSSKYVLPESFVAFQRSYFAEVDAFELAEEEAGSEEG